MRDFLKLAWVDTVSRDYWTTTFRNYQRIYSELEISSVGYSRDAAIITVAPKDLPEKTVEWRSKGLFYYILSAIPANIPYSNGNNPIEGNEPVNLRVLISTEEVYDTTDNLLIGRLLGYPACCARSFSRWWGKLEDPSFFWLENREAVAADILYRQLGVRFVRHLPCSHKCQGSELIANEIFGELMEIEPSTVIAIGKFMASGARFTRLHGAAEVTNDVLKFAYKTDFTPTLESFNLIGDSMVKFNDYEWKDNGFSSLQAQDRAHDPIILAFLKTMREVKNSFPAVMDYGCGNGALLEKLSTLFTTCRVYGVELSEPALRNAEARLPMGKFHLGNLFTHFFPDFFDVSMVSVKRLHESPGQAKQFIEHERGGSAFTIFYDYDALGCCTVLKRFGITATPLAEFKNNACEAVVIRWENAEN